MSTPSKTAAKLLAEHCKAAEEHHEQECEEKEHEDAKLANLQAMADCECMVEDDKGKMLKHARLAITCNELRKCKAAKAVDSNNKAGPSKRSNTMSGGSNVGQDSWVIELLQQLIQETCKTWRELPALISDVVFCRMAGLSKATRILWKKDWKTTWMTTKTMEEELERVNRRLRKRAEKSGK
ncbi:hypothetical protein BDQ12DRAFT_671036 [Crucibulum laeve]|uniref:Uncharacterized protein n=1 Tax=Crucibulum laeve TaxID=68775 RepID=A0A5C3LIP4_9AGAR|nr:hypothetical protein BDQ12DRAFT_671036 [Crucibulum laeve]